MTEFLRIGEVARQLRISRAQAYAMARRGELPVIRFGDHAIRVPADRLDAWLRERIEEPGERERVSA